MCFCSCYISFKNDVLKTNRNKVFWLALLGRCINICTLHKCNIPSFTPCIWDSNSASGLRDCVRLFHSFVLGCVRTVKWVCIEFQWVEFGGGHWLFIFQCTSVVLLYTHPIRSLRTSITISSPSCFSSSCLFIFFSFFCGSARWKSHLSWMSYGMA